MQDWVDPFLEAMCDRGAQGLVLTTGAPPVLRFPNSEQPVSRQPLAAEHLSLLMTHAGGPELWREMQARGTATWTQDRPGRRFRFVARGDNGRPLRIEVTSEDPNAPLRSPDTAETPPPARPEVRNGASPPVAAVATPPTTAAPIPSAPSPVVPITASVVSPIAAQATGAPAVAPATLAAPGVPKAATPSSLEIASGRPPTAAEEETSEDAGDSTATETAPVASAAAVIAPERAQQTRDPRAVQFLDDMLRATHAMRASDLHLSSNQRPVVRKDGQMQPLEGHEVIGPTAMRELLLSITPDRNVDELERMWDTDFAHEIAGVSRFRVNLFHDRHGVGGVFRVIPDKTPKPEDLGLPHRLIEMTQLSKGIVLVTGPTGSGKSTTLSALLDHINDTRRDHVITIEDPIEFVHQSRECLINQREIGTHAQTFKRALREALREDPDIVLVGEMRDLETVHIALETAETGHLVFGTLHTTSAPASIDRLIDQFPAQQQQQIRVMLADTLRCVVAQVLCRRKTGGRVAALEMMVCTPAIANLIREGKTHQIPSIMQTSKAEGMQLMTEALVNLVKSDIIEPEEALARATDRDDVWRTLERSELLPHQQAKPPKRR